MRLGFRWVAFDWKSDVSPTPDNHEGYASQLLEYLAVIDAPKGAIVADMTTGEVRWVHRAALTGDLIQ